MQKLKKEKKEKERRRFAACWSSPPLVFFLLGGGGDRFVSRRVESVVVFVAGFPFLRYFDLLR